MDSIWKLIGITNEEEGSKVRISPAKYVKSTKYDVGTDTGWLKVKLEDSSLVFLCERTKIRILDTGTVELTLG